MAARPFDHRRLLWQFAASALVLATMGCGRPDAVVPLAYQGLPPEIQAQAVEQNQEDEPGWIQAGPKEDLGHFFKVDDGLSRGQQPTDKGLALLKEQGFKTVIYLHFNKKQAAHEKALVEGMGMKFVHLPMSWIMPPKKAYIETWLHTTQDPALGPVFVHCQHGKDRTGAMVGIYRVAHDKWTYPAAYKEMKEKGFRTYLIGLSYGVKRYAAAATGAKDTPTPAEAVFAGTF